MYLKEIKEIEKLSLWVRNANEAFKNRSNDSIPYAEIKVEGFLDEPEKRVFGLISDDEELIGGMCITNSKDSGVKTAKIGTVWVAPKHQNNGAGTFLINQAEKIACGGGAQILLLDVANIYMPAVRLYKKCGFKKYQVYANVPGTYYFIRMIKILDKRAFPIWKSVFKLAKSSIIFWLLYKKDSSPTLFNKLVYKKLWRMQSSKG